MEATTETREVWTSPDGVPCYLTARNTAEVEAAMAAEYGDEWEPWFAEDPGARPPRYYHLLAVSDGRVVESYTALPYEPWSWYDAVSDWLLRNGWDGPPPTEEDLAECEHGLAAWLCAGPGHYPDDRW
jgi:hypothetical protein